MTHEMDLNRNEQEVFTPQFAALTISGLSGTGKTATAELLCQKLGLDVETSFIKVGQRFRQIVQEQNNDEDEVVGFVSREGDTDVDLDTMQKKLLERASLESPVLIEGRLAGIHAMHERDRRSDVPIVSILFICSDEAERVRRIAGRTQLDSEEIEISDKSRNRDEEDERLWISIYPDLLPEGTGSIYEEGLYTMTVDTFEKTIDEVALEILTQLSNLDYVGRTHD